MNTPGLTPEDQQFEDELKAEIKKVVRAVYLLRYAGKAGFNKDCCEVPDEICDAILDLIAYQQVLGLAPRPHNHGEFRAMVWPIVNRYLPGP